MMNNLNKDIDELINIVKDTDIYKKYNHIEEQLEKNEDINNLVNEIKNLQKEAVKEEQLIKDNKVKELDNIINTKLNQLNNIPLYADYLEVSEEVNNLILNIKNQIQSYIDNLNI